MEVRCQSCAQASHREGLDALPGGFGFTCPHCQHANILAPMSGVARVDAEAPAPEAAPAAEPTPVSLPAGWVLCPKCGEGQPDHPSCRRCGLDFAKAASGLARFSADPIAGHRMEARLRARWVELAGALDDDAGHRDFVRLCAELELLEFAGYCYRSLTPPGHEETQRVAVLRQRVITAAMAQVGRVEARATERDAGRLRGLVVAAFGALLVLGFAVGYYLLARYQTTAQLGG